MITGVYPNETDKIEIDGVKFTWALMPPKIHRSVQSRLVQFTGMSHEDVLKSGKMEVMLECFEDVVAFSVKNHEGFKDVLGKTIDFKTSKRAIKNDVYEVASDDVLKAYYYSGVIEQLGSQILERSNLSGQDQKNSVEQSA